MSWDVVGLGNAIMDALVVVDDADALLDELGLIRGTMHLVDDTEWSVAYDRVKAAGVTLDAGGSCANTIATLGRLGAKALYRGQVGTDELGGVYVDRMIDACGVHALKSASGQPTGKCLSIVSGTDAERTMLTHLGTAGHLPDLDTFAEALRTAKVAHFTGYTMLDGPMWDVVQDAMRIARDAGTTVSLDVADPFVVNTIRDRLWHVTDAFADVIFLNAEEARALTDQAPEHAAETVAKEARVRTVVVKLGSRGSIVVHDGQRYEIGIRKVHAIDTTGAGDAYAGGFLYGMVHGWTPAASGALGASVAAATVAQIGATVKDREALGALVGEADSAA